MRELICDTLLPESLHDIVWFEPTIDVTGTPSRNGLRCGDSSRASGNITRPDFVLSGVAPVELPRDGAKAYLIGEMKLSLKSFYNSYVRRKQFNQFLAIARFARSEVYSRTAVFAAATGAGRAHDKELRLFLGKEAAARRSVPVMFSALD